MVLTYLGAYFPRSLPCYDRPKSACDTAHNNKLMMLTPNGLETRGIAYERVKICIINWLSPKTGQVLKCSLYLGGGIEMVICWIFPRDLFWTSWEGLHEVLLIVIAEESRMFSCVLSLPQWRCCRKLEPLVSHTNVHTGCGRSWRTFLEWFWLRWFSLCTHSSIMA